MTKLIIYPTDVGGVNVVIPSPEYIAEHTIEELAAKDVPAGKPYQIVDVSDIPSDRTFRNAWELGVSRKITINLDKAKDITKDRLRAERTPLLQAQDIAFQRALEQQLDTTEIVAEKQRLRDIPQLADQANTLEELKAIKAEY